MVKAKKGGSIIGKRGTEKSRGRIRQGGAILRGK